MRTNRRRGLRSLRNRGRRGVVEHDKVDVARIIELARAVLAERQHDHAGAGLRIGRLRVERQPTAERVLAQQEGERGADGGVGETRQRLGRRDEVPYAADVGKRDQKRRFALGQAQGAHQFRFVVVAPRGERLNQRVERFARRTLEQPDEPGRILHDQRPEVARMVGDAEKTIAGPAALELKREVRGGQLLDQRSEAAPGFRRRRRAAARRRGFQRALRSFMTSSAGAGGCGGLSAAGSVTRTRSPGSLSSSSTEPPCMRATAAASERPSPEPGREREPSSRTNRSRTRARSGGPIPGPRSAIVRTTDRHRRVAPQ